MDMYFEPQNKNDTFRRINVDHVFICTTCKMCWLAKDLWKTHDKKYVCLRCNHQVKDVTDSPLGQSFLQIVKGKSL